MMKKLIQIFFAIFILNKSSSVIAQINLVPNPSFEDTVYCPNGTNQVAAATSWINFGNSPDYFNSCAPLSLNVPNSYTGFQYAHTGNAMTGVVTYVWQFSPGWPNYREFIGAQLLTPLNIGQKYFISFYINFAGYLPGWQKIGANKIGMKFTTNPFTEFTPPSLTNTAHLYTDSIYTDTLQWYKISGSFIADSIYNYVALGNFFDTIQTDTSIFGGPPFGGSASYYYLDDICVSPDSLYNEFWTGLGTNFNYEETINIFPNPTADALNITGVSFNEIQITDILGKIVYSIKTDEKNNIQLSLAEIPAGTYFITIKTRKRYYYNQIIIIH